MVDLHDIVNNAQLNAVIKRIDKLENLHESVNNYHAHKQETTPETTGPPVLYRGAVFQTTDNDRVVVRKISWVDDTTLVVLFRSEDL